MGGFAELVCTPEPGQAVYYSVFISCSLCSCDPDEFKRDLGSVQFSCLFLILLPI